MPPDGDTAMKTAYPLRKLRPPEMPQEISLVLETSCTLNRRPESVLVKEVIIAELEFNDRLYHPSRNRAPTPSRYFRRHPLNLRHVVVLNCLLTAVIPFDGYARPILFSDGALIGSIVLPANTVADVKLSGLFAGHCAPLWGLAALAKIDFILPRHCDCDSDSLAVL